MAEHDQWSKETKEYICTADVMKDGKIYKEGESVFLTAFEFNSVHTRVRAKTAEEVASEN